MIRLHNKNNYFDYYYRFSCIELITIKSSSTLPYNYFRKSYFFINQFNQQYLHQRQFLVIFSKIIQSSMDRKHSKKTQVDYFKKQTNHSTGVQSKSVDNINKPFLMLFPKLILAEISLKKVIFVNSVKLEDQPKK